MSLSPRINLGLSLAILVLHTPWIFSQQDATKKQSNSGNTELSSGEKYGYSQKNPIRVGAKDPLEGPTAQQQFLETLRDADGGRVHFKRIGSFGRSPEGHVLDLYEVTSTNGKTAKLYLDMYCPQNDPLKQPAPEGFYNGVTKSPPVQKRENPLKQFLNLKYPYSGQFCPIVISASDKNAIVAQVAYANNKRDIQILTGFGDQWELLGKNGMGITGVDGNFLQDAIQGPDGRLWVMAGYSQPSNAERGQRDFLYCFDQDNWKLVGPKNGHPAGIIKDCGMHFLGGNAPVHHFVSGEVINDTYRDIEHLVRLDGEQWVPVAAQELIRKNQGTLVWRKNDAWYFITKNNGKETSLEAYCIKGPLSTDMTGPVLIGSWNEKKRFTHFAVSEQGMIAMIGSNGGHLFQKQNQTGYKKRDLPKPFPYLVGHLEWSSENRLFATDQHELDELSVFVLTNENQWIKETSLKNQANGKTIFNPRLFFNSKGSPIVTWEDFRPH